MRIAFPTYENQSYLSHISKNLEEANYLTVLNVKGQNIVQVETIKNHVYDNMKDMVKEFKANKFNVVMIPEGSNLPVEALKGEGISVFKDTASQSVLKTFSDFVQDKLTKF